MVGGAVLGAATSTDGHYINPRALVVAAAFVAAYKSIETIANAFAQEGRPFDEALGEVFKFLGGLAVIGGTTFACAQRYDAGDPVPAIATGTLCVVFVVWGLWKAEVNRLVTGPDGQSSDAAPRQDQ